MQYYNELIILVIRLVGCVVGIAVSTILVPWLKNTVVPYFQDKHLYTIVCKFVLAAEKMAETGVIERDTKKKFVIDMLRSRGVTVTGEVEALIEAAVEELDLEVMGAISGVFDVFDGDIDTVEEETQE